MGSIQDPPSSYDIIIIGAGLAGINCAYRLQTRLPHAKITILEARASLGGTWELFKYPGIRSDSDLYTYGFAWEPWPYATPIAEGHLIVSYLHHCVRKHGLGRYMNFQHKVVGGAWSSEHKRWMLSVSHAGHTKTLDARFVVLGTGYYDYDNALPATIPGIDNFAGKVVHPQFWPTDYSFADKSVVVIGSGATAITLIPNLAPVAKHITMLQRSPSYIVASANRGAFARWWFLPKGMRGWLNWLHASTVPIFKVMICRLYPENARAAILKMTKELLPPDVSTDPHFMPRYLPWDQRLCLSPDGDFFKCLHGGKDGQPAKASVVTATIETVTEDSIVCTDGQVLKPDVIVTATGLRLIFGGGIPLRVDGELIDPHEHAIWDGCMLNDVPNLVFMLGYARASWTVGVDNTAITLCRLLKDMERSGKEVAVPRLPKKQIDEEEKRPFLDLSANYIKKDTAFPFTLASGRGPWKARGVIWVDWLYARCGYIGKALALS